MPNHFEPRKGLGSAYRRGGWNNVVFEAEMDLNGSHCATAVYETTECWETRNVHVPDGQPHRVHLQVRPPQSFKDQDEGDLTISLSGGTPVTATEPVEVVSAFDGESAPDKWPDRSAK